jgi:hypothetical protein
MKDTIERRPLYGAVGTCYATKADQRKADRDEHEARQRPARVRIERRCAVHSDRARFPTESAVICLRFVAGRERQSAADDLTGRWPRRAESCLSGRATGQTDAIAPPILTGQTVYIVVYYHRSGDGGPLVFRTREAALQHVLDWAAEEREANRHGAIPGDSGPFDEDNAVEYLLSCGHDCAIYERVIE